MIPLSERWLKGGAPPLEVGGLRPPMTPLSERGLKGGFAPLEAVVRQGSGNLDVDNKNWNLIGSNVYIGDLSPVWSNIDIVEELSWLVESQMV